MRTSNPHGSSDVPWYIFKGQIIPKICDGKAICRMISENQADSVDDPGRNDATIKLCREKLSKMHTSRKRPARVRFRS